MRSGCVGCGCSVHLAALLLCDFLCTQGCRLDIIVSTDNGDEAATKICCASVQRVTSSRWVKGFC